MRNPPASSRPSLYEEAGQFAVMLHHSAPCSYPEETHDTVQVCIPYAGARYDVFRSSDLGSRITHRLRNTDILVIPNGQPHAVNWLRPADILSLHLTRDFLEQVLDAPLPQLQDSVVLHDPLLLETAAELRRAVLSGGAPSLFLGSCATVIAYRIARQASSASASHELAVCPLGLRERTRVAEYIDARLDRAIKVSELARLAGLSQWHFLRRFHATEGITPAQFIIRRRMERARELLQHTEYSVSQIALEVGMSQSHFSRSFRRTIGVNPRLHRRQGEASSTKTAK